VKFAQGCSSLALSSEFTNNPELSYANVKKVVEKEYV
ncbi:MAG: pseudouridine kinase, partial [Klebsiella michiganensis]|nr:pseudouridine kinase [Klebsiella michiganensis]